MSISNFFTKPQMMGSNLSPDSVALKIKAEKNPDQQWEIIDAARRDSRQIKWVMALLAAGTFYAATQTNDSRASVIFCGLATVGACIANDHRRFQKVHGKTLRSAPLEEANALRTNWFRCEY